MAVINIICANCGLQAQLEKDRRAICPRCGYTLNAAAPEPELDFAQGMQFAPPPVQQPAVMPKPREYAVPQSKPQQNSEPQKNNELSPAKWIGLVLFCCAIGMCAFINSEVFLNTDWIVYPSVFLLMVSMLFVPALLAVTAPRKVAGQNPAFRFFLVIASYIIYYLIIYHGGWGIIHLIDRFF